jgi:hypothetical protein
MNKNIVLEKCTSNITRVPGLLRYQTAAAGSFIFERIIITNACEQSLCHLQNDCILHKQLLECLVLSP